MFLQRPLIEEIQNRPEKGGNLIVAFPAPPAPEPRAAHFSPSPLRRAVAGRTARLHQRFTKFSWRLASRFLKISPNLVVGAAPEKNRQPPGWLFFVLEQVTGIATL